ncbi:MAG: hypothetical protein K9L98_00270 [Candidatus Pacebacteria bacterium]|nr:hypothetical protein [Candidatus Paceibacterota bacterium]MCF7862437.1 hypothetical protein [Candidatus Paceibacterota bacterium]
MELSVKEQNNKLQWSALEYEEKERSPDWFWALGIVVLAGAVTSIIFENYFFALFLILSGVLMAMFAIKKPDMVIYEINKKGVKIRNRIYLFEDITTFWVQKNPSSEDRDLHGSLPEGYILPTLFIKTKRAFAPILSIPIEEENAHIIRNIMLNHDVVEEKMKEHFSDKIMDFIGF